MVGQQMDFVKTPLLHGLGDWTDTVSEFASRRP
jgi:hypothetical protein